MAQKVNITLVDDMDGTEAEETVTFGLNGTQYEIDLNSKNVAKLHKALDPFVGKARRTRGPKFATKRAHAAPPSGPAASEIRAWALANGYEVPAKGRIPAEIQKAFSEVH